MAICQHEATNSPFPNMIRLQLVKGMTLIGFLSLTPFISLASEDSGLYGSVPAEHYLTGRFSASKHPRFITLRKLSIPTMGDQQFLHQEAGQALNQMITAFQKEHPDIKIWVASAYRSFYRQRSIWEAKWTGRRKVDGRRLNESLPDPGARALKVLEYSAMPGASRHHWGTEVDFNRLRNSYYETGPGLVLYKWLTQNAARYGFCQPYTAGRKKGHREEKWHWSYRPLAMQFQRKWEELFSENTERFLGNTRFMGNQAAAPLAPVYQQNINASCTDKN